MKLSLPIVYNAFTFTTPTRQAGGGPASGCQINRIRFMNVEADQYLDKKALDDGLDAVDIFLNGRVVGIEAAVFGSTEADLFDRLEDLVAAFDPVMVYNSDTGARGFIAFDFFRPTGNVSSWPTATYPNGIPQRMLLRPLRLLRYDIDRDQVGGQSSLGVSLPVTIDMIARDPRIVLQSQTTLAVSASVQTAIHRGTHPVWPFVTFTVSGGVGASNMTIAVDGFSVQLDLSTTSTGSFAISYSDRHVHTAAGASRDNLLVNGFNHNFTQIQPGGSTVQGSNLTNVTVSVAWREAWLG